MKLFNFIFITLMAHSVMATIWYVGPNLNYKTCKDVQALVKNGDTVIIAEAVYRDVVQVSWTADQLYILGEGNGPRLEAGANIANDQSNGKGIFVVKGKNCIIENIEFANAKVVDHNGAGIRQEGANVLVKNCRFVGNEMGLLCGVIASCTIIMEHNVFENNGSPANPGYQHNVYIGHIDTFIFRYNYSKDAIAEGHELKSRAKYNIIIYNRISNENTVDSRTIDLPNGGTTIIMGNIIEQGESSANTNLFGYGLEGLSNAAPHECYVVNNTFVNKKNRGSFIQCQNGTSLLFAKNNIIAGANTAGFIVGNISRIDSSNNLHYSMISSAGFVDAVQYNYHLSPNSMAINRGIDIQENVLGISLIPNIEYTYDAKLKVKMIQGQIDIGAFEYQGTVAQYDHQENRFKLFPNPVNSTLTIRFDDEQLLNFDLMIYSLTGKQYKIEFNKNGAHEIHADLSQIPSGIYVLDFRNERRKFVVR
jgi:hypothetical protein